MKIWKPLLIKLEIGLMRFGSIIEIQGHTSFAMNTGSYGRGHPWTIGLRQRMK